MYVGAWGEAHGQVTGCQGHGSAGKYSHTDISGGWEGGRNGFGGCCRYVEPQDESPPGRRQTNMLSGICGKLPKKMGLPQPDG